MTRGSDKLCVATSMAGTVRAMLEVGEEYVFRRPPSVAPWGGASRGYISRA